MYQLLVYSENLLQKVKGSSKIHAMECSIQFCHVLIQWGNLGKRNRYAPKQEGLLLRRRSRTCCRAHEGGPAAGLTKEDWLLGRRKKRSDKSSGFSNFNENVSGLAPSASPAVAPVPWSDVVPKYQVLLPAHRAWMYLSIRAQKAWAEQAWKNEVRVSVWRTGKSVWMFSRSYKFVDNS